MWIRIQSRNQLVNASEFHIVERYGKFEVHAGVVVLGCYYTEKKALKVMDMIEDTILKCEAMRTGYAEYDFGAFVFDMPADKDVEV